MYPDFSNSRRAVIRKLHPTATNGEISIMLAQIWKEAPMEIKSEYIEREARLREQYKRDIAAWDAAVKGRAKLSVLHAFGGLYGDTQVNNVDDDRKLSAMDNTPHAESASQMIPQVTGSYVDTFGFIADFQQQNEMENVNMDCATSCFEDFAAQASDEDQVLTPLTVTDIGCFLAAAGAVMMDTPVTARVSEVLSALPARCMMDFDLPRTPTPPPPSLEYMPNAFFKW
jgi:hypothetical protein